MEPEPPLSFKPEMPNIPGLNTPPIGRGALSSLPPALRIALVISPLFILAAVVGWAVLRTSRSSAPVSRPIAAELEVPPAVRASPVVSSGDKVADIRELAAPWAFKTFEFRKSLGGETVPAMVIRLPGAARSSQSYWAFSLKDTFGRCQFEYVPAISKLSADYSFHATHPMVAEPCRRTVFDPLQLANLPSGAWARGAVVQGSAFRPPLAIEIRIAGDNLIATQME